MTQYRLNIFTFLLLVGFFTLIWQLIKSGKLRPTYALTWLLISGLFFSVFLIRGSVRLLASFLQIDYSPSLILGFGILFTVVLLLIQTVVLSTLTKMNTELAERYALLHWKEEELTERTDNVEGIILQLLNRILHLQSKVEQLAEQVRRDDQVIDEFLYLTSGRTDPKMLPFKSEREIEETFNSDTNERIFAEDNGYVMPFILDESFDDLDWIDDGSQKDDGEPE